MKSIKTQAFVLFFAVQALGTAAVGSGTPPALTLIWDRTYSHISPFSDVSTHFENIVQLKTWDYVSTTTIGLTWNNNNGYCKSLYQPEVFVREDELSGRFRQLHESSRTAGVRTRHKTKDLPNIVWWYDVPAGVNIAQIKLVGIQKSKLSPSGGGRSYLGECRFLIYALDASFGLYQP